MSTAIVFASRHGTTAEVARAIAEVLGPETILHDLADQAPDLSGHESLILGTAIYAGQPLAAMKTFAAGTASKNKRVALFVCGMEGDPAKQEAEIARAFPDELRERAVDMAFLGGRFQFGKMKAFERLIIKRVAKTKSDIDGIDHDGIVRFAEAFKERA